MTWMRSVARKCHLKPGSSNLLADSIEWIVAFNISKFLFELKDKCQKVMLVLNKIGIF